MSRASSAADATVWTASADNDSGGRASEPPDAGAGPTCVASATMIAARQSANARIFTAGDIPLFARDVPVGRSTPHGQPGSLVRDVEVRERTEVGGRSHAVGRDPA